LSFDEYIKGSCPLTSQRDQQRYIFRTAEEDRRLECVRFWLHFEDPSQLYKKRDQHSTGEIIQVTKTPSENTKKVHFRYERVNSAVMLRMTINSSFKVIERDMFTSKTRIDLYPFVKVTSKMKLAVLS
jgi:hypothetical protein